MSEHYSTIRQRFLKRREILKWFSAAGMGATGLAVFGSSSSHAAPDSLVAKQSGHNNEQFRKPGFESLTHALTPDHAIARGYSADVLIAWGDSLDGTRRARFPLRGEEQRELFGYNNDFIAYTPLSGSEHGLLGVNHEYPIGHLMFPGYKSEEDALRRLSLEQVGVEMDSVGHSVLEVRRTDKGWRLVADSTYARRIHANTPVDFDGPAAGHRLLRTAADPGGRRVLGILGCCSGGTTPWGTVLIAEENVGDFFLPDATGRTPRNDLAQTDPGDVFVRWADKDPRFNQAAHPNELNRFGWIIEYDPVRPDKAPVKHTALGRFEHEGATVAWAEGRPLVIYSGDDTENEYVYRYVSHGIYKPGEDHGDLLTEGTLYCAQMQDDGTGRWLPLRYGEGPLTTANGFVDQGQVLVQTRRAAVLLGATPMDRPEGIAINSVGNVYIALTKNKNKGRPQPGNPRRHNKAGHILEILPPRDKQGARHWEDSFRWDVLLQAGDTAAPVQDRGVYGEGEAVWLANPDNLAFDPHGRLWIATDGMNDFGAADGLWCTEVDGPRRAVPSHFYQCPRGAELCGPAFTPDGETLFVAVQHPGKEGVSHYEAPSTRWPDFREGVPPRPAVVAITRDSGGTIGD